MPYNNQITLEKMKKLILIGAIVGASLNISAQNYEFNLNKTLTVGCYNANPLTDMTKKVDVVVDKDKGTLTYSSLNCKQVIEGMSAGIVDAAKNAHLFINERDGKGFIVENNEKVMLFKKDDNSYKIAVVGHIDKKLAKNYSTETEQANYNQILLSLDGLIKDAKIKAEEAKKVANTFHAPEGNYSDKYGISGKYYLSEVSEIIVYGARNGDTKYADEVQLELDSKEKVLKIHYGENAQDKAFFLTQDQVKAFENGNLNTIYRFRNDHNNHLDLFKGCDMRLLEDGVWLLERYSYFTSKLDCSQPSFQEKENGRYAIIGKNKDRVLELMNNSELMKSLAMQAVVSDCETMNAIEAAKKPMPAPGMSDPKLAAEITEVVKAHAAVAKWPQTVVYAYPKNKEWDIIRNTNTGIIVGRSLRAIVVLKTTSGKCQWEEVSIRQNYDGANYGSSFWNGNTAIIVPVDCTDAVKYKK